MKRILILCSLLIVLSCSTEEDPTSSESDNESVYFPLDIGHQAEYQIHEIFIYGSGHIRDTLNYILGEEISGSFINDVGEKIFIVDRYVRSSDESTYSFDESWRALINDHGALRIEDNRTFIKMPLSVSENVEWNGNALFDASAAVTIGSDEITYYKNWNSLVKTMSESVTINDKTYNEVIEISLASYENKLELRRGFEKYAPGYGLIYKELQILDTQCFNSCDDQSWEEKADVGHIFIQQIL